MRVPVRVVAVCALAASMACRRPPSNTSNLACQNTVQIAPVKTDILLVVDNSSSMTDKQDLLANGLASFANRLSSAAVKQDFQVGVVTTSVIQQVFATSSCGNNGTCPAGCCQYYVDYNNAGWWGAAQAGRLQQAKRADGTLTPPILKYDDPNFLSDFQLVVKVGVLGSGEETEFEPARLAISDPLISTPLDQGGNQGLLRPGARLLIFAITDEDDCSEIKNASGGYDVFTGTDKLQVDYCYQQSNLPDGGSVLTPPQAYADEFQKLALAQGSTAVFFAAIAPVDLVAPHSAVQDPSTTCLRAQGCPPASCTPAEQCISSSCLPIAAGDGGCTPTPGCAPSFGVGRRLREMAYIFDPSGQNLDSICNASYDNTLVQLANSISAPQVLELSVPPPDGSLLLIDIVRADGTVDHCTDGNGFTYEAASGTLPARVSFSGSCTRRPDDVKIDIKLICAE